MTTHKRKPVVGETLYSLNVGNAARGRLQVLTPVIVTSVGKKYFTVQEGTKEYTQNKYSIEDWRENTLYTPDSVLYESEQEWNNEKEAKELISSIQQLFTYTSKAQNLSLETLRAINNLLNEDKQQ